MKLARWLSSALSLIYPPRCCGCDLPCAERAPFCEPCALSLEPILTACTRCGVPLPSAVPCGACLMRPPPWGRAVGALEFGGALAQAIRRLKLGNVPELARPLAQLVPREIIPPAELVVPVPLHAHRLRQREYNQAALIALELFPRVQLHALHRLRDTAPQRALDAGERRRNVRGAFRADAQRVRGRTVLLVDDVLTTGATADACTRALKAAGAISVDVLTVGRAVP